MANVVYLSRIRGRWVGSGLGPTQFKADVPAHEVLISLSYLYPDLLLAIASEGSRPEPGEAPFIAHAS